MTKRETIKKISEAINETQKRTTEILDAMQTIVFEGMAAQDEVKLFDGVIFTGVHKDACVKRSPSTGENIDVPEKTVPKVKFGTVCKRAVNGEE